MVTGLQRPVPQGLVDRQHGPALVPQHPVPSHQHLPFARRFRRRPRPAAGDGGVGALRALAALNHMPVVGGEDDHPAGMTRAVEQRHQVPDRVGAPLGATRVGTVERVVDRVQHAADERLAGHVTDGRGDVIGDGVAGPGRIQRLLVEQGRVAQAMRASQLLEPVQLDVLPAGAKLTAEQRGAADIGEGRQDGERGRPAVLPVQQCLGPAVSGARQDAGDDFGRHPGAHAVQDEEQDGRLAGQRHNDLGQQVLQAPHAAPAARIPAHVVAGVPGQRLRERPVVGGAPVLDGGENGGQPRPEIRVAHPGRRVVDGGVHQASSSP